MASYGSFGAFALVAIWDIARLLRGGQILCGKVPNNAYSLVVVTGPFIIFLLHNHFITEKFYKKKSGDVNDEANFSLFILLQERAKPSPSPSAHP